MKMIWACVAVLAMAASGCVYDFFSVNILGSRQRDGSAAIGSMSGWIAADIAPVQTAHLMAQDWTNVVDGVPRFREIGRYDLPSAYAYEPANGSKWKTFTFDNIVIPPWAWTTTNDPRGGHVARLQVSPNNSPKPIDHAFDLFFSFSFANSASRNCWVTKIDNPGAKAWEHDPSCGADHKHWWMDFYAP